MTRLARETTLGHELIQYIHAGYPGIWVHSYEQQDAVIEICKYTFADEDIDQLLVWDSVAGLEVHLEPIKVTYGPDGAEQDKTSTRIVSNSQAPNAVLSWMAGWSELGSEKKRPPNEWYDTESNAYQYTNCILVMKNLHLFLGKGNFNQLLMNYLDAAERKLCQRLVVLTTEANIPSELEKLFHPVPHRLPGSEQMRQLLLTTACQEDDLPQDDEAEIDAIVKAASGMTRMEAKNAFSLCLARDGLVTSREVFEMKAKSLKKSELGLELLHGEETFDDIGGLTHVKQFCKEMLENRSDDPRLAPKGIVLAGVPGTGKSLFAKALGNTVHPQRPTIRWDMGQTMSKYVGESQQHMKRCLDTIDAMSPCNLFADEFEKQIATGVAGGSTGGDVQTQMLGQWLTWHQEHETDVFVILTMNNIVSIARRMPELLARFDEVFFLDFPDPVQKKEIWKLHLQAFGHIDSPEEFDDVQLPPDENWTGRDIWKCCRQAAQRGISLHEVRVGTLAQQVSETIGELRNFAHNRWMSAELPDYYDMDVQKKQAGELTNALNASSNPRTVVRKKTSKKPVKKKRTKKRAKSTK